MTVRRLVKYPRKRIPLLSLALILSCNPGDPPQQYRVLPLPFRTQSRNLNFYLTTKATPQETLWVVNTISAYLAQYRAFWGIPAKRWNYYISSATRLTSPHTPRAGVLAYTDFKGQETKAVLGTKGTCPWLFVELVNSQDPYGWGPDPYYQNELIFGGVVFTPWQSIVFPTQRRMVGAWLVSR